MNKGNGLLVNDTLRNGEGLAGFVELGLDALFGLLPHAVVAFCVGFYGCLHN